MTPACARSVPWLADLAEVPPDAAWPRLLTVPSSKARGSYGPAFLEWASKVGGRTFRWWQQLTATLILAHDVDGRLVHRVVVPTSPRQVGKTYLVCWLAMWRITFGADLFGEPQLVVMISKDLPTAKMTQAPMRRYAREHPDVYEVRESGAECKILHLPSGSEWVLRSESSGGYGHGVSLAIVDEAWSVKPQTVDLALGPTQMERSSPQMILTSTANDRPTPLMLGRRALALAELDDPDASTYWLEWSLPPGAPLDDLELWRSVLPHWHDQRLDEIRRAHQTAVGTRPTDPTQPDPVQSVATQMGNVWPSSVETAHQRGEPVLDLDAWRAAEEDHDPPGPLIVAVEDFYGSGACVSVAGKLDDGRVFVEAHTYANRDAAFRQAAGLKRMYESSRVVVGASLERDPQAVELRAKLAGARETALGLPLMRELLASGRLAHYESADLTAQLAECRLTRTATGGLSFLPGARSDCIRSTCWAVYVLLHNPPRTPSIH